MKLKLFLLISSFYAASATHADDFYLLGAVGQSHFADGKSAANHALTNTANLTEDGTAGSSSGFENNGVGYKMQLGYQFNQNFAIEGGYVDLGQQDYRVNFASGDGNARVRDRGLNIDALGILPVSGPFSVFGKLGAIEAKTTYRVNGADAGGDISDGHEKYKVSPNFGVGGMYSFNDTAAVRLELERFADLGKNDTTGEQNVDLVSLGVSYRFN